MSESLIETKRRIETINSTGKITKAMKLVASVKLKRWKVLFDNNKLYDDNIRSTLIDVLKSISISEQAKLPAILTSYPTKRKLYIIVTSTLGLCGGYNYNIYKKLNEVLTEQDDILFIGNKGYLHYKNGKNFQFTDHIDLMSEFNFENVKSFRHYLVKQYKKEEYSEVLLVYSKYVNSLVFQPEVLKLLPLDLEISKQDFEEDVDDIILEPSSGEVLKLILPHYLDSLLFSKFIESSLCELSSRRNAMENATKNADEMNRELRIKYNKARQAKITQEIIEIVGGKK